MWRKPAPEFRLCFVAVLGALTPLLHADDAAAPDKDYHDVTVQSGGKSTVIRVKNSIGPRLHGQDTSSDGHYNPENMDLGRTSSFSNKGFSSSQSALSKNDTAEEARTENRFPTKSFSGTAPDTTSNFSRNYKTSSFNQSSRGNTDFQKSFATSESSMAQGKDASFSDKTSSYQGKTALVAESKDSPFSGPSSLADKKFFDPDLARIKRDPYASGNNLDVSRMVDLPNRPLTIDEVRNLINHETIPHLDEKPDAPSKSLNDPTYEPPTPAPFAHDDLTTPGPEEKDTELPSPGMMATPTPPENAEPLPK